MRLYATERRKAIKQLPKSLQVADKEGFLEVDSGIVVTLALQKSEISHDEARRIEEYWEGTSGQAKETLDQQLSKSCSYPCYLMREQVSGQIVGLAVFDKEFVGQVACLLLASVQRQPYSSPLHEYVVFLSTPKLT